MVRRTGYSESVGNEARNVVPGVHHSILGSAGCEVTLPVQKLMTTSSTCYLVEWNGRSCIVDEKRRPQNGDAVLLDLLGNYEWGHAYLHPRRIITDDGLTLDDDLMEDVSVVGVVTHEITAIHEQDGSPI